MKPQDSNKNQHKSIALNAFQVSDTQNIRAMNINELRATEHFKDWSEEELFTMIDTVRTYTEIVYHAWSINSSEVQAVTDSVFAKDSKTRKAA